MDPTLEAVIKVLGSLSGLAAVIGFGWGLVEYRRAQKWKRAEFLANQIKEYEANPRVRSAMLMLDFRANKINYSGRDIRFDDKILIDAMPHESLIPITSPDHADIRLAFCDFFDWLERMHHFLQAGLVQRRDLSPVLAAAFQYR